MVFYFLPAILLTLMSWESRSTMRNTINGAKMIGKLAVSMQKRCHGTARGKEEVDWRKTASIMTVVLFVQL
jgi:hypothetical protein